MENLTNNLRPLLKHRPFFENDEHCKEWVDDTLSLLQRFPPQNMPEKILQRMVKDLEYANKLLSQGKYPPQQEIRDQFLYVMREIIQDKKDWNNVDFIYANIGSYLKRKMAAENQ